MSNGNDQAAGGANSAARGAAGAAAANGALPNILISEKLGQAGIDMLSKNATVEVALDLTPEQLCERMANADALIVRSATKVTRQVIEASKGRLKVVGRAGVGIDNVDLAAATENGVMVVNAPNANTVAAAEHGIALLCALARNVAQADASVKAGKWERSKFVGVSLVGKTLAVLGFGKVGADVARRAKGLGMTVIAHDPYAPEENARALGVKLVAFDDALAAADFISMHMPLTAGTKNLLNKAAFAKCKKGVRIINVARGGVIDEDELVEAINSGVVAQAALDVFVSEPPEPGSKVVAHPQIVCTPHLGASTKEAQEGVAFEVAEAVSQALAGELSANTVNAPMVAPEVLKELQPYTTLAQGLGKVAVQLVADKGISDIEVTYVTPRGDDLDTRLLRANVIKGILEQITTANVNIINADLLSEQRGLKIKETTVRDHDGESLLTSMSVSIKAGGCRFTGAQDASGRIVVSGHVTKGAPYLTKIGQFDVDVAIEGCVMLVQQNDQPGIIAGVAMALASESINVSFMTVGRITKGSDAIMAIGIDSEPSDDMLKKIAQIEGIKECGLFK